MLQIAALLLSLGGLAQLFMVIVKRKSMLNPKVEKVFGSKFSILLSIAMSFVLITFGVIVFLSF